MTASDLPSDTTATAASADAHAGTAMADAARWTRTASDGSRKALFRRMGLPILALALVGAVTAVAAPAISPASAAERPEVIVLPGAKSAEGIARGHGDTFYAGDLVRGDIFRGDFKRGTAEMFIDVPDGRMAVGMAFLPSRDLLFVAGGPGKAYVYNTRTRATVASYDFADPAKSVINDVTLTPAGAWFTDSSQAKLFFIPISPAGVLGQFRTLPVTGPAAALTGAFNLNGIQAVPGGKTLIVGHSGTGQIYTVNPVTGASAAIAGVSVPTADGLVLQGRQLWVIQNTKNQVSEIELSRDLTSGVVKNVSTNARFEAPTTGARFDDQLAVVQGKTDTGFPPTADQYEVVIIPAFAKK